VDRSSKALKSHHSPVPSIRNKLYVHDASRKFSVFNTHVFAATILYYAYRHLDHWPEKFAQAYSEDSFGPRLWVDDARCSNFVDELRHSFEDLYNDNDAQAATAELALDFYKMIDDQGMEYLVSSNDPSDTRRQSRKAIDPKASLKLILKSQRSTGSEDSMNSSGSKDVDTSDTHDGEIENPEAADREPNNTATIPFLDLIQRQKLKFNVIRRRYFGVNLVAAEASIVSSLIDRLELKSKQNSGLLQSLPTFVSIPQVRLIISENLEQWLKSPALAGLARSLFTLIVTHMKNVDPPLKEDLRAIECILAMKLKSNQVRTKFISILPNRFRILIFS
jgi:Protein of unknown function (DUF3677)